MRRLGLGLLLLASTLGCSIAEEDAGTPAGAGCLRIDGSYAFQYDEGACGRSGASDAATVVVTQVGCRFNAVLPGYALLDGTVNGSTLLFAVTYLTSGGSGCGNVSLSGSGTITFEGGRTTLRGVYGSGAAAPGGSCGCLPASGAASFVLR